MTLRTILLLMVAVAMGLAGPGTGMANQDGHTSDAKTYTITIKDFEFSPKRLEIPAGAKVVWINKDEEPHKIAETKDEFHSEPLDTDGQYAREFKTPGTYEYFCTLHPRMTGKIVVVAK
jgi:plastocyanin